MFSVKPHNPMINAGAMVVVSLLKKNASLADRFDYVSTALFFRFEQLEQLHHLLFFKVMQQYREMAGNGYLGFSNST